MKKNLLIIASALFISSSATAQCLIGLSSTAGTDGQLICLGDSIVDIVYAVSGTTAYATGLPPGVNTNFNSGDLVIYGTPSAGGNYTYTVVSTGGCSPTYTTGTIGINPTATVSSGTFVCQGDIQPGITFTGSYGTAPYTFTYNINGGANQQVTTSSGSSLTLYQSTSVGNTYNYNLVSVEDATTAVCNISGQNSAIVVNALPIAGISGSTTICQNSAEPIITLTAGNGIAPYTFNYYINSGAEQYAGSGGSNQVTLNASTSNYGTFVCTLDSVSYTNGVTCSSFINQQITIEVDRSSYADFSVNPGLTSNERTITFNDLSVADTWTWYFDDGSYSTYEDPQHVYSDPGEYFVKLVASNGVCAPDSSYATIDIVSYALGVSEINPSQGVSVYPNPSTGIFNVTAATAIASIVVTNTTGQPILTKQVNGTTASVDLSSQPKGLYFYKITGNAGALGTGKLLVE